MNVYLLIIIFLIFFGSKVFIKEFNPKYLSKDTTSSIKGIFILIVFYSHLASYTIIQKSKDFMMIKLKKALGQLMVTMFLFYSGYGVYESIKKNKSKYVKSIPTKRVLITLLNFVVAVTLYEIVNPFIGRTLPLRNNILSFIGWESVGNSNWYIFGILFMYLITYLSFTFFDKDNKKAITSTWIFVIIFCLFMALYKDDYWFNTLFCYPLGLTYSFYKEKIEKIMFENKKYVIGLIACFISFLVFYKYRKISWVYFQLVSIMFSLSIVFITMKFNINNNILKWFGDNLFWIYILQRLPMLVLRYLGLAKYEYKYAIACFATTILLSFVFSRIFKKVDEKVLGLINYKEQ